LTDSLTLSLLLFFALVVLAVLAREVWRMMALRRDRVREVPARPQPAKVRAHAASSPPFPRQEPGFDSLDLAPGVRIEPDFPSDGAPDQVDPIRFPSTPPAATAASAATPPRSSVTTQATAPPPASASASASASAATTASATSPASVPVSRDRSDDRRTAPDSTPRQAPAPADDVLGSTGPLVPPKKEESIARAEPSASLPPQPVLISSPEAEPNLLSGPPPEPEPRLSREPVSVPPPGPRPEASIDPSHEPMHDSPALSPATDCIVDLACTTPIPGDRLVSIAQTFRRCGTKPVMIEVPIPGATAASARSWRPPQASDNARALRIGILLDNRSGPLNAMEFSEFLARIDETADRLGARYTPPQMADVLQAARRLDADCAQLDWNAGLNVDTAEVLGPGQLSALATPLLIVERGSNRYVRLDELGDPIFSVSLGSRPNRLNFLLDLPRVRRPQEAWKQMVECALIAARRLPGRLVDDGGKPLSERFLESSALQVHQRALALEAVGLKAGSAMARRVFN
jgi:hypothetical protein